MKDLIREIVTNNRSKAFGKKSCFYIGWTQNNNSEDAINSRIKAFEMQLENKQDFLGRKISDDFFTKKARFTLKHYKDKWFTGAFFQQWDERYPRNCSTMDYTPESLPEIIRLFKSWMDKYYNTKKIVITKGKKIVQEVIIGRKIKRRKYL